MNEQLIKELDSQSIVAQFVPLRVNADQIDGKKWLSLFPSEKTEAMLYVVRADGKTLYSKQGIPQNLPRFLRDHLRQSGKILSNSHLERLEKTADAANRLYFDGEVEGAVQLLANHVDSGSFAKPAQKVNHLAKHLTMTGQGSLSDARNLLNSDEASLDAALHFLYTQRAYGKLPGIRKVIHDTRNSFAGNEKVETLFEHAEHIIQAHEAEAEGEWHDAVATYEEIYKKYPETEAAQIAHEAMTEIKESGKLEGENIPAVSGEPTSADKQKAASYLKFAKTLKNPEKVREYAEKVIKIMGPDAPLSEEAQEILLELDEQ